MANNAESIDMSGLTTILNQINEKLEKQAEAQTLQSVTLAQQAVVIAAQTKSHDLILKKIDGVNTNMDKLESRLNEKITASNNKLKEELTDHVREQINLSEGAQNTENKRLIESNLSKIQTQMTIKLTGETNRLEESIKVLDERVTIQEERVVGSHINSANIPRSLEVKMPIFKDEKKYTAFRFIRDMENYFRIHPIAKGLKLSIIPNFLDGTPREWFNASSYRFHTFEDFCDEFTEKYCNEDIQFSLRENLINTTYNSKSGISKSEHFVRQVLKNQDLKEPFTEKKLITIVIRHYDSITQQVLIARKVSEIVDMELVLEQLDRVPTGVDKKVESTKQENTQKSIPKDNSLIKGSKGVGNRFTPYPSKTQNLPPIKQEYTQSKSNQGGSRMFVPNSNSSQNRDMNKSGAVQKHINSMGKQEKQVKNQENSNSPGC